MQIFSEEKVRGECKGSERGNNMIWGIFSRGLSVVFFQRWSESLEMFIISKVSIVIVTLFGGLRTMQQGSWILVFGFMIYFQSHWAQVAFLLNFFSLSTMKILLGWSLRFLPIVLFLIYFFLIEGQLLYKIVLVSAKHQHESLIGIHMSPHSWTSLPPPSHPIPLGCYWSPVWVSWVIQQIPTGYLFYIW